MPFFGAARDRFGRVLGPFPSCHGPQAALKCSYRSDSVTRDWPVALRARAAQSGTRISLWTRRAMREQQLHGIHVSIHAKFFNCVDATTGNPSIIRVSLFAARTLNATGQSRVTLSLR